MTRQHTATVRFDRFRSWPGVPVCLHAATMKFEVFRPADGRPHGSLEVVIAACDLHVEDLAASLHTTGLSLSRGRVRQRRFAPVVCGSGTDFGSHRTAASMARRER